MPDNDDGIGLDGNNDALAAGDIVRIYGKVLASAGGRGIAKVRLLKPDGTERIGAFKADEIEISCDVLDKV